MEIETEMSIYFGNDRVHPVEYKHPVELLVVSIDIYEFVSKMLQKGAVETHFVNCTVFTISNHISGGVIGVKYNDGRLFGNKHFWKLE